MVLSGDGTSPGLKVDFLLRESGGIDRQCHRSCFPGASEDDGRGAVVKAAGIPCHKLVALEVAVDDSYDLGRPGDIKSKQLRGLLVSESLAVDSRDPYVLEVGAVCLTTRVLMCRGVLSGLHGGGKVFAGP